MSDLLTELFPLMRTSVGPSIRESLVRLQKRLDLSIREVASGTRVGDWIVPEEWEIAEAYIEDSHGNRLVDLANHSLHILNGSTPIDRWVDWNELESHLFTDSRHETAIPYRTSYYEAKWGFCISQLQKRQLQADGDGPFHVVIQSARRPGALTIGELLIRGESDEEVIFSAHLCHPSLANDNLSGVVIAVALAQWIASKPRRYSYRFLFGPGTLGPIAWWHQHEAKQTPRLGGSVLTMLGDSSTLRYKQSRSGESLFDQVISELVAADLSRCSITRFEPEGYDERQFNSSGIQIPMGRLSRADWKTWPAYHSSLDSLENVEPSQLTGSLQFLIETCMSLELASRPFVAWGAGEPQLGRHGLWKSPLEAISDQQWREAIGWISTLADGSRTPSAISQQASLPIELVRQTIGVLSARGLLK